MSFSLVTTNGAGTITVAAGLLTQIDHVRGEKATRKTLSYLGGRLVSVVQTTMTGV